MFGAWVEECRENFRRAHTGWKTRLGFVPKPAPDPADQVPDALRRPYRALYDFGLVVWACRVQANNRLYERGDEDLPGILVYSTERHFDRHPQDLREISHAVYDLKDTSPVDADLRAVADHITDEYNLAPKTLVTPKLTGGRRVWIGATCSTARRCPTAGSP